MLASPRPPLYNELMTTKKAFTLIELMIVVAIIAILTLLAITNWHQQINRAKDAQRKKDLNRLKIAFEDYYNDHQCYPPADILNHCEGNELQPYLNSIPCDPSDNTPYCYIHDPDNQTCGQEFRILAALKNPHDPAIAELGCNSVAACGYETTCQQITGRTGYNYGVTSSNVSLANPNPEPAPNTSPTPSSTPTPTPSPSSSPTPTPTPSQTPLAGNYACDPQGICNYYSDPIAANCPVTFANSTCNYQCADPNNRCSY